MILVSLKSADNLNVLINWIIYLTTSLAIYFPCSPMMLIK